jgi:hypothetical protein
MRPSLAAGGPCRFRLAQGHWQRGTLISLDRYTATIQPGRTDVDPIELPRRQVKPLLQWARQRAAVAGVLVAGQWNHGRIGADAEAREAGRQEAAPEENHDGEPRMGRGGLDEHPPPQDHYRERIRQPGPPQRDQGQAVAAAFLPLARLDGQPRAVPKPPRRLVSRAYLRWIRSLPCCACGAAPGSHAHHYGRRGVGQLTDDPRTIPLCESCHLSHWHGAAGTLPGYPTPEAARLFVLRQQVVYLVRYLCEHGAEDAELQQLLARAQVDALVCYFALASQRRRRAA